MQMAVSFIMEFPSPGLAADQGCGVQSVHLLDWLQTKAVESSPPISWTGCRPRLWSPVRPSPGLAADQCYVAQSAPRQQI
ncbi:hypothetical protein Bpfe_014229 [Biomphalaria pfeifferi]|uniref:Uncharacterized protein n=1 Tax=Biomphalaria pfeifferi TaxID=112525 RepID=A0AAD8FAX4_BIOPF|nr:hypothetical protein Bpfe_014229 [Biomphalaria pfeifferi]